MEKSNTAVLEPEKTYKLSLEDFQDACNFLRQDSTSYNVKITTPFGQRKLLYADSTASGCPLKCIQNFISHYVSSYYANTHTFSNATSMQMTHFRMEARRIIKHYLNANHNHALIFTGSGSTAAVKKFLDIMEASQWTIPQNSLSNNDDRAYAEDRWGAYQCLICSVVFKNECLFRAHEASQRHQKAVNEKTRLANQIKQIPQRHITFFCDPTAHHSCLLPFREIVARETKSEIKRPVVFDLVQLEMDENSGTLNLESLAYELDQCEKKQRDGIHVTPIVILCAVSNVTGIALDIPNINTLIHQHHGVACWDFSSMTGHLPIDIMGTTKQMIDSQDTSTDVGFFSTHKLLGGPGSSGFLIIKKSLLQNKVPSVPGGGVIFYASSLSQSYICNTEEREEAGTPNILGDIQAGAVFQLYTLISSSHIVEKENTFSLFLRKSWADHPGIVLLGPQLTNNSSHGAYLSSTAHQIGIISFMLCAPRDDLNPTNTLTFLHYGFVVKLLNDLFGIQVRGGCACAGPLAHRLLGMTPHQVTKIRDCLNSTGYLIFRPGFVRLSLNFTMSWDDIFFLDYAIRWTADHGWRFLPFYSFFPDTGEWECIATKTTTPLNPYWLGALKFHRRTVEDKSIVQFGLYPEDIACPPDMQKILSPHSPDHYDSINAELPTTTDIFHTTSRNDQKKHLVDVEQINETYSLGTHHNLSYQLLEKENQKICEELYLNENRSILQKVVQTPTPLEKRWEDCLWFLLPRDIASFLLNHPSHNSATLSSYVVSLINKRSMMVFYPLNSQTQKNHPKKDSDCQSTVEINNSFQHFSNCETSPLVKPKIPDALPKQLSPETFLPIPRSLRRLVGKGIHDFSMIQEGDRLLVGVSGGKDSLTLIHILRDLQRRSPVSFTFAAATVDPQTPEYNPSDLKIYFQRLGIPYYLLSVPIVNIAKTHMTRPSICSFCSRMKRGILYSFMKKNNFNGLVLGQHLDDICESFLMSAFQNGVLNTMKAHYVTHENLRVLRPLVYVREKILAQFATSYHLPVIIENCPACFVAPKERQRMKILLAQQEYEHPHVFSSLLQAIFPLLSNQTHSPSDIENRFKRPLDELSDVDEA